MPKTYPEELYDGGGTSVPASGSLSTDVITLLPETKLLSVFVELTYNASATAGGHVDMVIMQPNGVTECTDTYTVAVTPGFAAGATKSKLGLPIDVTAIKEIKLKVVNEDTVRTMTLKKLYLY